MKVRQAAVILIALKNDSDLSVEERDALWVVRFRKSRLPVPVSQAV